MEGFPESKWKLPTVNNWQLFKFSSTTTSRTAYCPVEHKDTFLFIHAAINREDDDFLAVSSYGAIYDVGSFLSFWNHFIQILVIVRADTEISPRSCVAKQSGKRKTPQLFCSWQNLQLFLPSTECNVISGTVSDTWQTKTKPPPSCDYDDDEAEVSPIELCIRTK